eukprot:scpid111139/ scgid32471/ 
MIISRPTSVLCCLMMNAVKCNLCILGQTLTRSTPRVDESVLNGLGRKHPKALDQKPSQVQTAVRPPTCAWSDAIKHLNSTLVPIEEMLDVFQRTLVLLGHANADTQEHCAGG